MLGYINMAQQKSEDKYQTEVDLQPITLIDVSGFKSFSQEQSIDIRPLTILAGANSSGKSSMMQPLLLLKQTLEASYDPGALLLNGPNVKFTQVEQLLSRLTTKKEKDRFTITIWGEPGTALHTAFKRGKSKGRGFDVVRTIYDTFGISLDLREGMSEDEIQAAVPNVLKSKRTIIAESNEPKYVLVRNRCFLSVAREYNSGLTSTYSIFGEEISDSILQVIHLPGLRGNPERDYPATFVSSTFRGTFNEVGPLFPGTFESYVASIIDQWQLDKDEHQLTSLFNDLARLALTNKVVARRKNDTAIELLVNRFPRGNKEDMVSIADVGLGVSQALPVVVALHAANPGQLVYIEQPEIHLHPRAQFTMAEVLADAAKEGKRLVVETHSSLLLRGVQTLVAEGKLPPDLVKLHWFTLLDDGTTQISSADLDETGAFGDWPEDFHTVTLNSESRNLDAAEALLMGK
jgi:predicted ATP-binding protein involved in virulence